MFCMYISPKGVCDGRVKDRGLRVGFWVKRDPVWAKRDLIWAISTKSGPKRAKTHQGLGFQNRKFQKYYL